MLLAIDAGNTNIVFALVDLAADGGRGAIRARWRMATDARHTGDEYAVWVNQLLALEGLAMADITAVIISTVVPRALHNLTVLASKYIGVEPLIAGRPPVEWSVTLDVPMPETVGADRAANAIAAHAAFEGDLIIIDFGTATTFDHIDYSGAYKGGIIAPGINLSLDALVSAAARLPRIAVMAPVNADVIGRTTEDQMLIGVFWGYVAMMEGLVARMRREIGRPVTVIATGGLAILFDEKTDLFDAIVPDLTINGLVILYQRSQMSA
ncbi:MAG: pantothenate kinase [Sphingobium sp. 66-54]|nr:MAG: pantothenate kinase [Sphingobium sp. 66-54]